MLLRNKGKICKKEGCSNSAFAKELCQSHYSKQKHLLTRDKRLAQMRINYRQNAEKRKQQSTEAIRKRLYNITPEQYSEMLIKQNNLCAICGKVDFSTIKNRTLSLSVDHCHKTGKIRELLCNNCNLAMGNVKEDPEVVIKLLAYINKHKS